MLETKDTRQPGSRSLPWGRSYLMCPPEHFDVAYSINPWMDLAVAVDRGRAQAQWDELVAAIEQAGASVETATPRPGLPDMVFTANAGLVIGDVFVSASMRHAERRGERSHFEAWFAARGRRVEALEAVQEGAGDALPLGGALVAGFRTRSTAAAYAELSRRTGARTVAVELADPRFYHLDLAFCPLGEGRAMIVPSAFGEAGRAVLSELVPEPLLLEPEEGEAFCANSVVVGRTVIMPACPPRVRRHLEVWGLEPVVVDVSEFLKAGGGPRCLTLALDVEAEHAGAEPERAVRLRDPAIDLAERHGAHNYEPLPIVVARADGAWVWDGEGRPYLDALAAYSALNFGHRHPRLVAAARRQLDRVTLTSRAFHNDQLGPFCQELAELCGKDRVLPMNTGAEGVETAIKVARKWGYEVRGVAPDRAKVVVCAGNFHGRTVTIVSFSDDPLARDGFGPFTPGFVTVPYGDREALADALSDGDAVAFLVEPVQGEAGVVIPPDGYLAAARELCTERGVLMVADEIQSGLGRTGRTFACDHEGVVPDVYVLGKALGGGIVPLSAVVADDEVLGVLRPGEHGSTFGGNPLACAVGREVLRLVETGEHQERSARLGARALRELREASLPLVAGVRGRGLWIGIDLVDGAPPARAVCERLLDRGLLCKDTHETTIRLAPPLVLTDDDLDFALAALRRELGPAEPARAAA
ncbi:MAG TPA: ornithine--oxo-acid transaminase [Thermoleophilaceae bacterium]